MSPIAQKWRVNIMWMKNSSRLYFWKNMMFCQTSRYISCWLCVKGNFELHLYDPETLDTAVKSKAGSTSIISLDPLMKKGGSLVYQGYFGRNKDFGQVARPGNDTLFNQAKAISSTLHGHPVVVSEDDIFSGGSVIASNAL